jgi:hypothetical protein
MRTLKSERGQMTVEMVLLMIVALTIALMTSNFFKQKQVLKTLVGGPWAYIRTMNEYGVWLPNAQAAVAYHPNGMQRVGTPEPGP